MLPFTLHYAINHAHTHTRTPIETGALHSGLTSFPLSWAIVVKLKHTNSTPKDDFGTS